MDKLEKTNKRALRLVVNNGGANYEDICMDENQLNIYNKCIRQVAVQMYKIKRRISPQYLQSLFNVRETHYDMRDNNQFIIPQFTTVNYGKRSLKYYGAKLWSCIPLEIKERDSLAGFKSAVTTWLRNLDMSNRIDFL